MQQLYNRGNGYFHITFFEILQNTEAEELYTDLISELMHLVNAKKTAIDTQTVAKNVNLC